MTQATDSQIAMWRGAIALAWANSKLDEGEKQKLQEYVKDNEFLSDAQRAQLMADTEHPITLDSVWVTITDPVDRAHLIDIAPTLFTSDGTYTADEHAVYDKMFAEQMASVDTKGVQQDVAAIKSHIPVEMAEDEQEYLAGMGFAGRLIYHIEKKLGLEEI